MAEKEFIEREAASRVLCDACGNAACPKGLIPRCSYYEKMQSIPAADVRPVGKARWLTGNDNPRTYGRIRAMCGRCGAFALAEMVNAGSYKEQLSNFCPNCGADMRETENG